MNSPVKSLLVAGLGDIQKGDDAFAAEVIRRLQPLKFPSSVRVMNFGTRAHDLAKTIAGEVDQVILVDAMPRGDAPGTLYLIEPELAELIRPNDAAMNGHTLTSVNVLLIAFSLNCDALRPGRIHLVGCEPATLRHANGNVELSKAARATVPNAVRAIRHLVRQLLSQEISIHRAMPKAARELKGGNSPARRRNRQGPGPSSDHCRLPA